MSVIAPKAEANSDHWQHRTGHCGWVALPETWFDLRNRSLESCATSLAIMNGPLSNRCCQTSRAAFVG